MATLTLRLVKGSPLTNQEVDDNFSALNTAKYESGDSAVFSDVQLSGGVGTAGTLSWNTDEETVDLIENGTTLQIGQEVQYNVRNDTASAIADGTPVMATGSIGASGRITVAPMDATDPANARYYLGIATETIAAGEDGKVAFFGKVRNLDLSAYAEGDVLWLSTATVGALTATEPTFGTKIATAFVISNSATVGTLFVRATNSIRLQDVDDVQITGVTDGELLVYNSTLGGWENQTIAEAGLATAAQGALADTALQDGDTVSSLDLDGGTIDGTVIGGSSAAAGTFTTFTSTGIDDNATSTAITIDSSEKVGIGKVPLGDATLELTSTTTSNAAWFDSTFAATNFYLSSTGGVAALRAVSGALAFRVGGDSNAVSGTSEAMRIDSSGTLLSPNGDAFVGTVSNSGNGAIIERGSNANGEFVKFADGTLICTINKTVTDQAISFPYGSNLYQGLRVWTYPASFTGGDIAVSCGLGKWGNSASWSGLSLLDSNSATLRFWDIRERLTGTVFDYAAIATGRWY